MENINIDNKEVSVEQIRSDWAMVLMTRGIIVKLTLSKCPFYSRLTENMLGLKFIDDETYQFSKKYLSLGSQKLIPPDIIREISRIESNARKLLSEYSFDTVWGHFVPFKAFSEWNSKNTVLRNIYMEQAMTLGNRYDEIISIIRNEYKKMAKDVWARLYPTDSAGPTPAFVENFVSNVISKIPPREEMVSSFKYDVTYFIIPLPSFIEEDLARAKKIEIQSELDQQNMELEKEVRKRISEDYISKKQQLVDKFLKSTVTCMRKYVGEICEEVLQSLSRSAYVNSLTVPSVNKIKALMRKVKVLNFYDDVEILNLLNQLETEVDKIKGEVNKDFIVSKLREIVVVSAKECAPNFNPSISVLEP